MSKGKYLTAAIPEASQAAKQESGRNTDERFAALEAQFAALNEQLVKQNRDNLDAEYNIDEENLSESLLNIIKDLQARVKALEEIVNNP